MEEKIITAVDEITNSDVIEEAEPIDYTTFAKNDSNILDRHRLRLRKAQHEIRRLELNNSDLTACLNERDNDNEALIRALSRTYADVEKDRERGTHFQELNSHKSELLWTIKLKCRSLIGDSKPVADGEEESEVVKFAKEILDFIEEVL